MRMMLKDVLQRNGYEVIGEAGNAEEAVARYRELSPDVVTLDVIMPGKTGIETLGDILAIDPQAVVVMVSAMGQDALIEEAKAAGAKSFIVKPFRPNNVAAVLEEVLGS
jgi:two-component system chemotaxis response regulator CheY